MSEYCVCGNTTANPSYDCERCRLIAALTACESELAEAQDKALRFKNYVHARMDQLGAPHEVPESEHTKAGCRIGGRFDWVERQLAEAQRRVAELEAVTRRVKLPHPELAYKAIMARSEQLKEDHPHA
jgi:hypothetical protein